MHSIKKVLIANRGEIARRIQSTCRMQGIATVAVYAPQDACLSFVYQADQACALLQSGAAAYRDQEALIACALRAGADAIHPGYGFLSENADFAQKVIDAGLCWIGPAPDVIRRMGSKVLARGLMREHAVPLIPGFAVHLDQDDALMVAQGYAEQCGFPLLIKDPLSGGGKGIRRVQTPELFASAWQAVCSESVSVTHTTTLLIEKMLVNARHVEVQVAGDGENFVHLFERECSLQRRHQKIVEESFCRFIAPATRELLHATALTVARAVGYNSIGTVEFLVDQSDQIYFLEMNTRLQVEHSVTEMVTGIDLVGLQLDIARSNRLSIGQNDITEHGHAIECRVYAEDPERSFMPCAGTVRSVQFGNGPFVRVDHDLVAGQEVTPFFDPMIAKITAWGINRRQAIDRLYAALTATVINGCTTNITFLKSIMQADFFADGNFSIHTLASSGKMPEQAVPQQTFFDQEVLAALCAFIVMQQPKLQRGQASGNQAQDVTDTWREQSWR